MAKSILPVILNCVLHVDVSSDLQGIQVGFCQLNYLLSVFSVIDRLAKMSVTAFLVVCFLIMDRPKVTTATPSIM